MKNRRAFLSDTAYVAVGVATTLSLSGCDLDTLEQSRIPADFIPGSDIPWTNWAGNQTCVPSDRLAPSTDDELVMALKNARGVVRPVGSSHSFSPVVPTGDTLLATDLLSGVVSHNPGLMQTEIWAGTRMHNLGPMLDSLGQALPNMPDMDYPSMGGAVATSVHGTSPRFGSISSYVTALTLATPSGELIDCSATENADIFQAARTSVGALGVISRLTFQNQAAFNLTEVSGIEKTEVILENLQSNFEDNRLFEFFPIPYTEYSLTVSTNLAQAGDVNVGEDDPSTIDLLRKVFQSVGSMPVVGRALYEQALGLVLRSESQDLIRTGASYKVLPHDRIVRFREMEYTVPAEHGPDCLREILQTIREKNIPMAFPIEYRHVKSDDIWLSMFEGRDGASLSIHQFGNRAYEGVFAEVEPIFWKYGGRPHWGKIHTLTAAQLAPLYSRHWQDFQEVRLALDPHGRMMNDHLKLIFGT